MPGFAPSSACDASAIPVAVAIVPSIPASPRFACTGIFFPGATLSSSRISRDAPSTSRSCGQLAFHTASTSRRRVIGCRCSARAARAQAARSAKCSVSGPAPTGSGCASSCREVCTHEPGHARSVLSSVISTASTNCETA